MAESTAAAMIEAMPDDESKSGKVEQSPGNRRRWFLTISLLFSFFAVGLIRGQDGVVFLDLLLIIRVDIESGSFLFLLSSIGYLSGSLASGIVYHRVNKELVYFIVSVMAGLSSLIVPFCPSLPLMGASMVFRTLCCAFLVSGGTFILTSAWRDEAAPFIQALFFMFSVGCLAVAFITKPFLLPERPNNLEAKDPFLLLPNNTSFQARNTSLEIVLQGYMSNNDSLHTSTTGETQVHMSFIIVGIIVTVSSIPFLIIVCRNFGKKKLVVSETNLTKGRSLQLQTLRWPSKIILYTFIGLIYASYGCLEKGIGTFFMPFVVKYLCWEKASGATLMSCFFGFYAGARFLGIFFAKFISAFKMAVFAYIILLVGGILLFFLANEADIMVWVSAGLIGLSLGAVFPAVTSFVNRDTLPIDGILSAYICVVYAVGTIIHVPLLGFLFENVSPAWFIYLTVGETIICFASFVILFVVSKLMKSTLRKSQTRNKLVVNLTSEEAVTFEEEADEENISLS